MTIPQERVRIFDRQGYPLAEFQTLVERSWVIGDEGRAQFSYPSRKTDVVNEKVLQFGNWLLVENDSLPPWVGVLDVPREWEARDVTVSAYTPERVFSWRIGPPEEVIDTSAGDIFETLIQRTNEAETTILRVGSIYKDGDLEITLNPHPYSDDLLDIYDRSGQEYGWRPVVKNGKLLVYADWVEKLGAETQSILQSGEGGNLEASNKMLVEDAPIVNSFFAFGDGETWKSRPQETVTDASSIQKYGLREYAEEMQGVKNADTLRENAQERLDSTKEPDRLFGVTALNLDDTFSSIDLGNTMKLRFEKIGFSTGVEYETDIRIVGMDYNPLEANKIEMVVEEL